MHDYDSFNEDVICTLGAAAGEDNVALVEPMSRHTTFKIGGPADVLVTPETPEALVKVLDTCAIAGAPVTVVGNRSDLLVGDRGIRGVVVLLRENFSGISVEGTRVTAEAGALLRDVALAAADAGLSGLEPLWGIPATVGGACFMNAGAYDACTADVLESVTVYVPGGPDEGGARLRGSVRTLGRDELGMGYRKSRVASEGLVVISATFALAPGNSAMIRADMDSYQRRREEKQPLELPARARPSSAPRATSPASSSWTPVSPVRAWAPPRSRPSTAALWSTREVPPPLTFAGSSPTCRIRCARSLAWSSSPRCG